ncbi:MAG TPA: molybdenum-binding protein [Desulfotomaculum sp.]|nr:molybdenum-binding protein [Desulfotomaculum sp.]
MRPVFKIWLENNGKVFGEGPLEILQKVEKTGSLRSAAAQMGMSYNKAWRLIAALEERLGYSLLEKRVGGACGGGSKVTPYAQQLMKRYSELKEEAEIVLEKLYLKHFEGFKT